MIELPNNITSLILKTLSKVSRQGSRYHTRNVYKFNFEDVFSEWVVNIHHLCLVLGHLFQTWVSAGVGCMANYVN